MRKPADHGVDSRMQECRVRRGREVLLRSSCRRNGERSLYTNERIYPLASAYGMDPGCWIEDRWKASVDGRAQPDALSVGWTESVRAPAWALVIHVPGVSSRTVSSIEPFD